ncbi:polysaccharide deacetylase [Flavobacterium cyanobacteriorum]|uniref:Polysaccharide deacetylase n=1 Tax=Flavobacterium cyanobacteriorum TaxID=2022802 RepID=A0A255YZS0_9FLAO|nr:polysaccharide deacetylase family protein [Flavobacterium cyanobacteriorum]OYQ34671.1 polysaccharide deacetylase [Flavobacterium cyanobacteriorum]
MQRLSVLMYHNICQDPSAGKGLTISLEKFEQQLKYLKNKGYVSCHLSELQGLTSLTRKTVVLTFDDVTQNQLAAVRLLKQYGFRATFFIPFAFLGKTDAWNNPGTEKIMTPEHLKSIDPEVVEFGHHSFLHRPYASLSEEEIHQDFMASRQIIEASGLKVYPAVAYPYGNFPKQEPAKSYFKKILESNGIRMGFRIGNRVNTFPFKDNFEINRIDVRGEWSLLRFRLKIRFGKLF